MAWFKSLLQWISHLFRTPKPVHEEVTESIPEAVIPAPPPLAEEVISQLNETPEAQDWLTMESIVTKAKELIGYTMAEKYPVLESGNQSNKGRLGQLIEEYHFGLQINNEARPDFEALGIELKTSPLRRNSKDELVAKERISLGMIDYFQIIQERFHSSGFWRKNEHLLIIFYIHSAKPFVYRKIHLADLWQFSKSDLIIIEQDWNFIRTKVEYGLAHELSEGDTMYLGAATKGASKASKRDQPNGSIRAMSRAYSLKTSYVNRIIRAWMGPSVEETALIGDSDTDQLESVGFDEVILERFRPFYGWEIQDIAEAMGMDDLNLKSKSVLPMVARAIMGVPGKAEIPEFEAAGVTMKTIRLKPNGTPQESMSFPAFKFKELAKEKWLDSKLFTLLDSSRFLFVVFDRATDEKDSPLVLKLVKFWTMPQDDIAHAHDSWKHTQAIVRAGNIVQSVNEKGARKTNFPGSRDFEVVHVRPHASTVDDTYPLPTPDGVTGQTEYTKQSFWLGNQYLKQVIS